MSWRTVGWNRAGVAFIVIAFVAGCSGSDGDPESAPDASDPTTNTLEGDNFVPVTGEESSAEGPADDPTGQDDAVVVSCGANGVEVADDWPFGVSDDIIVASTFDADDQYVLAGATLDAEQVLIDTMATAFPDFTVGEPGGGANDMTVDFTSDTGGGRLVLSDPDQDGCWSVEIRAAFGPDANVSEDDLPIVVVPDVPVDAAPDDPDEGDGGGDSFVDDEPDDSGDTNSSGPVTTDEPDDTPPDTIDPFDQVVAVGSGDVVSARGTFRIAVSRCVLAPLSLEAVASTATLTIELGSDNVVKTVWTYDDGVVIEDADSRVLRLDDQGGSVVANGVNPEGPETLLIDFLCD